MSDSQERIIGNVITQPDMIKRCTLTPGDFYIDQYAMIYQAALKLESQREPVNAASLYECLLDMTGENWLRLLGELGKNALLISSDEDLAQFEGYVRRDKRVYEMTLIADQIKSGEIKQPDEVISRMMKLSETKRNHSHTIKQAMMAALDKIEEARERGGMLGVTTGYPTLDEMIGGYNDTDLIVFGARPAMGKTAFVLNSAERSGKCVGIISSEQGHEQIGQRYLSSKGQVNLCSIRSGDVEDSDWAKITGAVNYFSKAEIYINDEPRITIEKVIRQAREWKHKYNIQALFLDYIQRIDTTEKFNRKNEQVGEVVKSLKAIAKELEIPVVALAQVSRACEDRNDKRPHMGDLADSSEIEKESDVIGFLYRDDVYNKKSNTPGIAELNITKNRHGECGTVRLSFFGPHVRFEEVRYGT